MIDRVHAAGPEGARSDQVLDWRCRCGAVTGYVTRRPGIDRFFHVVCHCRDCQAFQHALGRADDVLDAYGGTAILGTSPATLRIASRKDRLAALRPGPTGLLRWYAGCCGTPLCNTLPGTTFAHVGLIVAPLAASNGPGSIERAWGPVQARLYGRRAPGGSAPGACPGAPLSMLPRLLAPPDRSRDAPRAPAVGPVRRCRPAHLLAARARRRGTGRAGALPRAGSLSLRDP